MIDRLLRRPEVRAATGRKDSALYSDIRKGLMTKPVKIGDLVVAWPESEVAALNRARVAGASEDQIRALVLELHAKRTAPQNQAEP